MELENYVKISYYNTSRKTFYRIIRDILTKGSFQIEQSNETETDNEEKQTNLNDELYEILKQLNIDENIMRFRCLIKLPKKSQIDEIKEKQISKSEYYKKYYEEHKADLINKNLERYYKKKQGI